MPDLHCSWLWLIPAALIIGCQGARPAGLGPKDGKLAPCPSSPNCVSSQASDAKHRIDPLSFIGPAADALMRLEGIVRSLPRATMITRNDGYLHAEFTSTIFRFVDDAEFLVDDAAKVIHVRSASRLGTSDLGVNRKRIERIRKLWSRRTGA